MKIFCYIVFLCIFLISSASIRSIAFVSFTVPIFAWNIPLVSPIFLNRSLVFPILLFSSIIKHCSLKKAFLSLLASLRNSAFHRIYLSLPPLLFASLCSSAICKASSDNHFAFLLFISFGMVLFTASCTVLQTSVHSSSGTFLTRSSPLNLFVTSTVKSYRIWLKSYLTGLVFSPLSLV